MDDAIADYRRASERNDIDALVATLAPDAEVVSPISGRMVFRGHDDLRFLLGAVYSLTRDLRWREEICTGAARVVIGDLRVGQLRMSDAMAFELGGDGLIRRIRPHLRPWLGTTLFALLLGPRVARRPSVVLRALRKG